MSAAASGFHKTAGRWVKASLLPVALASIWQVLASDPTRAYVFVPLQQIASSALELVLDGELFWNVLASLRKTLLALLLGGTAGLAVGTGLAASRLADRAFGPLLHALRQVPSLGLAPLIGLWFGTGELAKVLLIFLAVFYPVLLSTYAGARAIDPRYLEVARVYRLRRREVFQQLMLPAMLPALYTGLSQAVAFAWITTVGSEMLLTSGPGIGGLMQQAQAAGRMDSVLVCVSAVAGLSLGLDFVLKRVGRRLMRWQDATGATA